MIPENDDDDVGKLCGPSQVPRYVRDGKEMDKVFESWPDHIFVFGSNRAGIHGAGAARWAYRWCGAGWKIGEGLFNESYALPTKDHQLNTLSLLEIKEHVDKFIECANQNPELDFFVTRVGCGLAGYTDADIAPLFEHVPVNVELPHKWGKPKDPMRINGFFGPYRFLSNFWYAQVVLHDVSYPTVEHAFQAAKSIDPVFQQRIREAASPGEAKKLGRQTPIRADWENVKIDFMRFLVWNKFSINEGLKAKLLATGEAELVEENNWGDVFWGRCKGQGENWLGRLLMETRERLKHGSAG
jgi:ribA/ribD-fused uncharacterized protein